MITYDQGITVAGLGHLEYGITAGSAFILALILAVIDKYLKIESTYTT
jgi:hypothetical protein